MSASRRRLEGDVLTPPDQHQMGVMLRIDVNVKKGYIPESNPLPRP
jgi:hypothetical protein